MKPSVPPYEAYLFDLDGTLLDSTDLILENTLYTLRHFGGAVPEDDLVRRHIGIPLADQYKVYLGAAAPRFDIPRMLDFHMDHQLKVWKDYLRLFDGVPETLQGLKDRGARMAVVTSRRAQSARTYAEGLGIWHFMDEWITPETTAKHKPDPEPAREALRRLGTAPERSLFVGDAVFDIACGRGAGCDTAYVAWGYLPSADVRPEPTWVLDRIGDLLAR